MNSNPIEQYKDAAEKGSACAQFNLATMYRDGSGTEKNTKKRSCE